MENESNNKNIINEEIEKLLNEDEVLRELYNRQKNSNEDIDIALVLPTNKTIVSLSLKDNGRE